MTSPKHTYAGGAIARYLLLGAAVALSSVGLVMIYSASSITAAVREGASWHYLGRQALFIVMGGTVAWFVSRYDYRLLKNRAYAFWAVGVGLLLMTVVVGAARGGARRWIPLGLFNLQPSELAKIACILVVSALAVEWSRGRMDTKSFLTRTVVLAAIPTTLIVLQPDLGTAVTLLVAVALVLFLAGIQWRWIGGAILGGLGVIALGILAEPYRMKRLTAFMDPWEEPLGKGYQTIQALYAFGTGGIDGVGLGLSRQKFFYLPEAHTDFILAIIGEEVGLLGTVGVLFGFVVLVWAGMKIASGARDPFGRLVAGAITGMLGFQAFLNMASVTGILPVTGKPLPFVSYGGSSMLVTMIGLGLLLSVSQYGALAPRAVHQKKTEEPRHESTHERWRNSGSRAPGTDRRRAARR